MDAPDQGPVPAYFNTRYVLWFIFWKNAITTLSVVQLAVAAVLLVSDGGTQLISPTAYRLVILANSFLVSVLAQFDRRRTPDSLKPQEQQK